jgi:hypothetical protein
MRRVAIAIFLVLLATAASGQEQPKLPSQEQLNANIRNIKVLFCGTTGMCDKPCAMWAKWQPDFQFSYEACIANCPKVDRCGLEVPN